jgi:hypothetical protein
VNDVERTVPLPGPIEELRLSAFTDTQARAMLAQALSGVELGGLDREIVDFLPTVDTRASVVVASLIRRAWAACVQDGKSERLDEVVAVAKARQDLRALALTVLAAAERADTALDDEDADRQYLVESLVTGVRMAVVAALGGAETGRLRAVGASYAAQYARAVGRPRGLVDDDAQIEALVTRHCLSCAVDYGCPGGHDLHEAAGHRTLARGDGHQEVAGPVVDGPCELCGHIPAFACEVEPTTPNSPSEMTLCDECLADVRDAETDDDAGDGVR